MSSSAVSSALRLLFATHGLPDVIVSDNGAAFTSAEFKEFAKRNGIRHVTTAPYHPSSNGQAERMVQTTKEALSKITGKDIGWSSASPHLDQLRGRVAPYACFASREPFDPADLSLEGSPPESAVPTSPRSPALEVAVPRGPDENPSGAVVAPEPTTPLQRPTREHHRPRRFEDFVNWGKGV
ncbi:hypothetical protein SKAU_G00275500 [Synaphobranchus kaupii]|uniref:Integrase catalytic domain-containing protein n=1 Tax=Synaphobranchus kaupii TaxID=118154 RepID=A0A9Q1IR11_SYNKA|nr:hypothetical protein SKAU_G00275500 [Synaphobranchus kaupii]